MADIFSVIADPTRRQVLALLLERYHGEISVSELVLLLELSQPTVSKHLRVLRDAGLVTVREVGQHRFYTLDPAPLEEVEDWLIPYLSADFDELEEDDGFDIEGEPADLDGHGHPTDHLKSQASLVGERVGHSVAEATGRARSIFEGVTRRIPNISRSSD